MGISDEKSSQEEYNCTCTHSLQTIKFTEIQQKVAFSLPFSNLTSFDCFVPRIVKNPDAGR